MPITKVPITHKFGIISQSQREDLQSRLLRKNLQEVTGPPSHQPVRNPLELSDEFIRKFNTASELDEKESLEDEARKLLARARRRAGLKDGGKGNFVDLPKAWSELSMLAQCRGKVQEECLDALIISLHQAPLSRAHIPCLFYLAETTLYWIRTDAMNQPFLRIGEIKLLKMGYTAFLRLFYHHMVGHLNNFGDRKDRLATYLSAILEAYEESEEAYQPYPGSHLCLKFIVSVGKMMTGDVLNDHLGDSDQAQTTDTEYVPSAVEISDRVTPVSPPNSVLLNAMKQQKSKEEGDTQQEEVAKEPVACSPGYASSIHDLSPTLWHALDVWRCVDHLGEGFANAMRALSLCGSRLGTEHWVDASCAIRVIGETAKSNLPVLKMFQNLAKGIIPQSKAVPINVRMEAETGIDEEDDLASLESGESSKHSATSLDSMEIKFEEMMGLRTSSAADGNETKKIDPLGLSPGHQKLSDTSHGYVSQQKSTRNTSMCAYLDTPCHDRAASLTSGSAMGTKRSPGSSSYRTIPDISSCESQLDSAGGMKRWSGSRLSDVDDVEDEDSDLVPGDDSFVEPRNVDVTRNSPSENSNGKATSAKLPEEGEQKLTREVSFDIEIINNSPSDEPKRKSSMRGGSKTTPIGTNRSPSTKSVVIDPVPSTTFYSEGSDGASEKTDQGKNDLTLPKQVSSHYGITSWPWEVAYMYTEMLTNICLYGKTANIKKIALIGSRNGLNVTKPKEKLMTFEDGKLSKLQSTGLLDLAEICKCVGDEGDDDDWSWRVRFAAISGLVKISRSCQSDRSLEGIGTVVWNMLMNRHSQERDERVMEAFRVGQVDAQLECEMQKAVKSHSLNFRLAAGLASNYLPPLQPPVQPVKRKQRPKVELPKPTESLRKGPNRPSLREELLLATALQEPKVSFYQRTDLDLKRIVEDQWRKELQEEMEEEERKKQEELEKKQTELEEEQERKKQEELEKKQTELEEEQREIANRKKEKLNRSSVKEEGGG